MYKYLQYHISYKYILNCSVIQPPEPHSEYLGDLGIRYLQTLNTNLVISNSGWRGTFSYITTPYILYFLIIIINQFGLLIKEIFATIIYPVCDSIFDFFVDTETMQSFVLWDSKLEEFEYSKEVPYFQLMVPTIDTTKFTYTLRLLLEQ